MDRNQPQPRRQAHLGEHFQCPALVNEQILGNAEQNADNAILTARAAYRTVIAVDGHRVGIGLDILVGMPGTGLVARRRLVVCHGTVLSIAVAATVTIGTDKSGRIGSQDGVARPASADLSGTAPRFGTWVSSASPTSIRWLT